VTSDAIAGTRDTYKETGDLARLLAQLAGQMGAKELKNCTVRNKIYCTGRTRVANIEQKSLVLRHDKPNEQTKEGPFSLVLFESSFTSLSTVSRSTPSL
jgi:hypothetical protein